MTYSVYQHWDPLRVCIVGRTYPPEFFKWIAKSKTRNTFEKLAEETEEDYQYLIKTLENKFNVQTLRPEFPHNLEELYIDGKWIQPPTAPRDYFIMIHDKFWIPKKCCITNDFNLQNGVILFKIIWGAHRFVVHICVIPDNFVIIISCFLMIFSC